MAINRIKVANEAKQDITISKADQILGRLADQTIIAKTVKSVQRGIVYPQPNTPISTPKRFELATVNPVGDRYMLVIKALRGEYSSAVAVVAKSEALTAELVGNKICTELATTGEIIFYKFAWELIEFYQEEI